MKKRKKILLVLFLFFTTNVFSSDINYEKIGEWNIVIPFGLTSMLNDNSLTTLFNNSGSVTLNNKKGNINSCIEKGYLHGKNNISSSFRCHITMNDNAIIFLEYNYIIRTAKEFWDMWSKGLEINAPNNGMEYFFAEFKMMSSNEKYSWLNGNILIGKGEYLRGPTEESSGLAKYDLFILKN